MVFTRTVVVDWVLLVLIGAWGGEVLVAGLLVLEHNLEIGACSKYVNPLLGKFASPSLVRPSR